MAGSRTASRNPFVRSRPSLDEADIRALLAKGTAGLDLGLLRDYYRVFVKRRRRPVQPLVGPDVGEQHALRPTAPVRDLDEFLRFLERIEGVFGPVARSKGPTTGEHFRL